MKINILLLVMTILSTEIATAQILQKKAPVQEKTTPEPDFANTGEQEAYWAAQLFKNKYKEQHYEVYKGLITTANNTYWYGTDVVMVNLPPELQSIFVRGIFYPRIIEESRKFMPPIKITLMKDTDVNKAPKDTMTRRKFVDILRTDSLAITAFEELKPLEDKPTQRRFKFWLLRQGVANPTACFMELTNKKATAETDMETFMKGAELTFFREGWVII